MTYLIVGCGNLGSELAAALRSKGHRVLASYCTAKPALENMELIRCDVTNPDQLKRLMDSCIADEPIVFWFAASHHVDRVQHDPAAARRVNVEALEHFLFQYADRIKRVFFSSSDCVYGAPVSDAPVPESAPTDPVNEYGRQKQEAERIVARYGGISLRFSLLFGESCSGKKGFASVVSEHLKHGETLALFHDSRRCVLSFRKAAQLLVRLLDAEDLPGVINVCSNEYLSKYEIGRRIAEEINRNPDVLRPVPFSGQPDFARIRVQSIRLDNSLLRSLTGLSFIESGL